MNKQTEIELRWIRRLTDELEERCRQRLNAELGVDEESIEIIMNLRHQVIALQDRLKELESALETYRSGYSSRFIKYRQVVYEADWEDG